MWRSFPHTIHLYALHNLISNEFYEFSDVLRRIFIKFSYLFAVIPWTIGMLTLCVYVSVCVCCELAWALLAFVFMCLYANAKFHFSGERFEILLTINQELSVKRFIEMKLHLIFIYVCRFSFFFLFLFSLFVVIHCWLCFQALIFVHTFFSQYILAFMLTNSARQAVQMFSSLFTDVRFIFQHFSCIPSIKSTCWSSSSQINISLERVQRVLQTWIRFIKIFSQFLNFSVWMSVFCAIFCCFILYRSFHFIDFVPS